MTSRIVLAYSGSLASTAAVPWLAEAERAEVVALALDLGDVRDLEELRDRALAAGAVRAHVLDVREELARDYVLPALQAGAFHDPAAPVGAALGRALVAKKLVEMAAIEGAPAVAHAAADLATAAQIEGPVRALDPAARVAAPARTWAMTPDGVLAFARSRHLPVPAGASRAAAVRPVSPTPAVVDVAFERGVPVEINGVPLSLVEILESLAIIAPQHGVTAGPTAILHAAREALVALVCAPDLAQLSRELGARYAALVLGGAWCTPLREALDAFAARVQAPVTGVVRVKLFQGAHEVVGRTSPHTLAGAAPASEPALA